MPIYIDGHEMGNLTQNDIQNALNAEEDKFGVKTLAIYYNKNDDKIYCICQGPDKKSIQDHHSTVNLKCDFIAEVKGGESTKKLKIKNMNILGMLTSRLAHDIRNPLSIIKNSMEILKIQNVLNEDSLKQLEAHDRAVDRIVHQVDTVLDYIQDNPSKVGTVVLCEIIGLSSLMLKKPNGVKINIPKNDITIQSDPHKLDTLFDNLIHNAIYAVGQTGEINIRINENNNRVIIEVEDSGLGISDFDLPQIFDPLFTTKQIGTGLGLVSCKNIVESLGGEIFVRNYPTTFTVILPKIYPKNM
ncbi:MAG: hypothetical protein COA77_07550 [Thaumarchaeota archaeon]|nr:MAG: hypothetical protein COA77_07550 [Nitrososphaerota archaeon]